jgi:ribosome-binding protein aMBF1 (putative translation factor)
MKTKNAVEILRRRAERNPGLKEGYEEEKTNFKMGLLIREEREKAGLTQAKLAELIGTTQSVISRLEDADYEGYSFHTLQKIAEVLHRSLVVRFEPLLVA